MIPVDAWDPAKDEAAGLQCKVYGAAAIKRVLGRLHIARQEDNVEATWRGYSIARCEPGPHRPPAWVAASDWLRGKSVHALWKS